MMFMQENQHIHPTDITASWQNKNHKWQYLWKAVQFCVRKIYTFVKIPKSGMAE